MQSPCFRYIDKHPGGPLMLENMAGKDCRKPQIRPQLSTISQTLEQRFNVRIGYEWKGRWMIHDGWWRVMQIMMNSSPILEWFWDNTRQPAAHHDSSPENLLWMCFAKFECLPLGNPGFDTKCLVCFQTWRPCGIAFVQHHHPQPSISCLSSCHGWPTEALMLLQIIIQLVSTSSCCPET